MTYASLCNETYENGARLPRLVKMKTVLSITLAVGVFATLPRVLFAQTSNFPLSISPGSLPFGALGSAYNAQLTANNGSGSYQWSVSQGNIPPGLILGSSTGAIAGTPAAGGTYPFVITVMDLRSQQKAQAGFTIGILNIANQSPLPSGNTSNPYSVTFNASDGPPGTYTWSIDTPPPGLQLSGNVLSGTPATSGGPFNFMMTVTVTPPAGLGVAAPVGVAAASQTLSTSKAFSVTFGTGLTIDTPSPLPAGDVGVSYAASFHALSGRSPFTWSVDSGLPDGLSIVFDSGTVQGTPTAKALGTSKFNVMVQDADQASTMATFMLTINPAMTITTAPGLPGGATGAAYAQIISVTGGTPPYTFSLANGPPGLSIDPKTGLLSGTPTAAGNFSPIVTVKDFASQGFRPGSVSQTFQLPVASSAPQVGVTPTSLSFSGAAGGDSPPAQAIVALPAGVTSAGFHLVLDSGQDGSARPAWLGATPTNGATPARIVVRVDQGSMPAGNYSGRVRAIDTSNNPTDVPVTLALTTADQQLDAAPRDLHFAARVQAPGTLEQIIVVRNSGGGGPLSFSTSVLGARSWIAGVAPSSGQTARNAPVFLRVRVNTQGLQVGSYHDVIRFSAPGCDPDLKNCDISVSLFVAASGSILGVDLTGVTFHGRQGSGYSHAQTIKVLNLGDPGTAVNWTADVPIGDTYVSTSPASGTATPISPGTLTLTPTATAVALPPGGYYALVRISAPGSMNSPQYVLVVFDEASSSAPAKADTSAGGLFYTAAAGGSAPPQQVDINASSSSPFQAATSTTDGADWLKASPASGIAGPITISVSTANLAPGIYTGEVDISIGGFVVTVSVTFVVRPAGTVAALEDAPAAGCTPSKLALTETSLTNNFSIPAKWPAVLTAQLNDDCGAAVSNGSVVASFSNGDPPLSLRGDGQSGTYSATWQAGAVTPRMVVTLQAAAGTLQPATAQLTGATSPNEAPVLAKNGTLHNLDPVRGGPLAPGTIAQVYGSGLASATALPGALPLLTTFNGTSMLIGGISAPLYYLSSGQLDVQIPSELAPNQQYATIISANGALTLPDQIDVIPAVPGVAALADGHVIAQHGLDYSYVDAGHPAKPNEVIIIYLAGMGATNPSVASGDISPAAQVTLPPTVTLDGQTVPVAYAGLTPGSAGLYQINFQVPANAHSGDLPLTITQNGIAANATTLPVQ